MAEDVDDEGKNKMFMAGQHTSHNLHDLGQAWIDL